MSDRGCGGNSSSPRLVGLMEGLITRNDAQIGAIKLPIQDTSSFIEQFNQTYRNHQMELSSLMTITPDALTQKKCLPCEGGVPPIPGDQAGPYLIATPDWSLDESGKMISRKIQTKNFVKAMDLVQKVAEIAETEQHHPDLHITGYRNVRIDLTTHAIGGLSENDFIVAAKIDEVIEPRS